MKLSEISRVAGSVSGEAYMSDLQPLGYSIDSRTVREGELFFAIRGENNDGHRFVSEALEKGALAAVVDKDFQLSWDPGLESRLIRVGDTLRTLQSLASAILNKWAGRVVAVTGSTGKTTTKEITARLLEQTGRVIKSTGNYNNHFGLPLSVLKMESDGARAADFDFAVLEMGMNHRGEIARLAGIAPPQVGVVTNVAPVHLEFFDSVDSIAEAKSELIRGIRSGGTAILNTDDQRVSRMRELRSDITVRTFGIEAPADIQARNTVVEGFAGSRFSLCTSRGEVEIRLRLAGRHNIYNALAACAVAEVFEVPFSSLGESLESISASKMRGEVLRLRGGVTLVDDSYNSNPRSLREMVATLAASPAQRRLAVAGEMLELGPKGGELHREAGQFIARRGIDLLLGVRGLARQIVEGAREAGMASDGAIFCETPGEAADLLLSVVRTGDTILVKGSRGVKMEILVDAVKQELGD